MGSSSSKDSRSPGGSGGGGRQHAASSHGHGHPHRQSPASNATTADRLVAEFYNARAARAGSNGYGNDNGHGNGSSRPDIPLFLARTRDRDGGESLAAMSALRGEDEQQQQQQQQARPRETRQEKEARRAERERLSRLKERERSLKEEGVDGGFLVTLGTYTGPEDFNKAIVRQLQIERRLAPFWKGLDEHSDSWAEHQLVAAARGLPIPAADEVPAEMARSGSQGSSSNPRGSDVNVNGLTVPISSRSQSYESSTSANLSASHPAFSNSKNNNNNQSPLASATASTAQLLRGRAKTLASLASGGKNSSPDLIPQEIRLPNEPSVNGSPVEAYLYKDASECPICFLYYPPFLNRTRCCDQPICSECFVQIKRPDPHPPEHEQPGQSRPPEEEAETLVSEVAACPFCVTPEFGVSYEPPPFRRGLAYAHQQSNNSGSLHAPTSAMSSSSSLASGAGRRRATSLSANAPQVVTTDRVRPDWAKKLADARAHALRRSAAATALHNAAYVLGSQAGDVQYRGPLASFGRRRRTIFVDTPGASGSGNGTPAQHEDDESGGAAGDLQPDRNSSRRHPRTRVDDLEDLMMMEAIRLSLAAEEERKKKVEKEARKEAKKKDKEAKKEAKAAKRNESASGGSGTGVLYPAGSNDSTSTWASTSMGRSTSNLGSPPTIPEEVLQGAVGDGGEGAAAGKGKGPAQDFAGFHPLSEPTSTLNTEINRLEESPNPTSSASSSPMAGSPVVADDPQRHLEESRATLQGHGYVASSPPNPTAPGSGSSITQRLNHTRQLSNASSLASSLGESSLPGSLMADSNPPTHPPPGPGNVSGRSNGDDDGGSLDVSSANHHDGGASAGTTPSPHEPMLNFRSLAAMVGESERGGGNASEGTEKAKDGDSEHVETLDGGGGLGAL